MREVPGSIPGEAPSLLYNRSLMFCARLFAPTLLRRAPLRCWLLWLLLGTSSATDTLLDGFQVVVEDVQSGSSTCLARVCCGVGYASSRRLTALTRRWLLWALLHHVGAATCGCFVGLGESRAVLTVST